MTHAHELSMTFVMGISAIYAHGTFYDLYLQVLYDLCLWALYGLCSLALCGHGLYMTL